MNTSQFVNRDPGFYAKVVIIVAGFALGILGLYLREIDQSLASSPIDTASNVDALGHASQHKTWFDGIKHWVAFYSASDSRIELWSSENGTTWSENLNGRIAADSSDFSVSGDEEGIYIVYRNNGKVFARRAIGSSQLVLRPNGEGSETSIPVTTEKSNWEAVSEEEHDSYATHIEMDAVGIPARDLYTVSDPTITPGPISKVRVSGFCLNGVDAFYSASIKVDAAVYDGDPIASYPPSGEVFSEYYYEWNTNPLTSQAWEWSEISTLEAGVVLEAGPETGSALCTQVYTTVYFEPLSYPTAQFYLDPATELLSDVPTYTITGSVDSASFNPTSDLSLIDFDLIHAKGNIYAYAGRTSSNSCLVATFEVSAEGSITDTLIDYKAYLSAECYEVSLSKLNDTVYGLSYIALFEPGTNASFHSTFSIDNNGLLSGSFIDTEPTALVVSSLDHATINNNHIVQCFSDDGTGEGYLLTLNVSPDGTINGGQVDYRAFDANGFGVSTCEINERAPGVYFVDHYNFTLGNLFTSFTVSSSGLINFVDFLNYESVGSENHNVVHISGDTFAVAYQGSSGEARLATFSVDAMGNIGDSLIDSMSFQGIGTYINIAHIQDNIFLLLYPDIEGNVIYTTVEIDPSGIITPEPISSFVSGNIYPNQILSVSPASLIGGFIATVEQFNTFSLATSDTVYQSVSIAGDDQDIVYISYSEDAAQQSTSLLQSSTPGSLSGMSEFLISTDPSSDSSQTAVLALQSKQYAIWTVDEALYGAQIEEGIAGSPVTLGTLNNEMSFSAVKGSGDNIYLVFVNSEGKVVYLYYNGTNWVSAPFLVDSSTDNRAVSVAYDTGRGYPYLYWLKNDNTLRSSAVRSSGGGFELSTKIQVASGVNAFTTSKESGNQEIMVISAKESGAEYSIEATRFSLVQDPFPIVDSGGNGTGATGGSSTGGETTIGGTGVGSTGGGTTGSGTSGSDETDNGGSDQVAPPIEDPSDDGADNGSNNGEDSGTAQPDRDNNTERGIWGFELPQFLMLGEEAKETITKGSVAVSQTAAFTSAATASATTIVLGAAFLNEIPAMITRAIFGILSFFRLRKKGVPIGIVYNSVTKDPISGAIIRMYDNDGSLVRTDVTNYVGVFYAEAEPGKYKIKVSKSGFKFPSQIVNGFVDNEITNVYHGDLIEIKSKGEINYAIPLDPIASSNSGDVIRAVVKNRLGKVAGNVLSLLVILGLVSSIVALIFQNDSINIAIFLVYAYAAFISYVSTLASGGARYGTVRTTGGVPVEGIRIGLRDLKHKEIVSRRVTDEEGRYRFIVNKGEYRIELDDKRFMMDEEKGLNYKIIVYNDRTVIKVDFEIRHKK